MTEHKKCDQTLFGDSIVRLIEKEIHRIARERFSWDKNSFPEFLVSLDNEDMKNQKLMITINHNGVKFTERLFPRDNTFYGYDSVEDQMINMFNQTM